MYQDPESPVIERYFVDLGDRQVHYRLAGSGPPLLLLHQSPASSAEMATELEAFADEFTVIAPDTPGFGLSDPLPDVSGDVSLHLTHFVRALEEFLSALGVEKTLIYGFHTGAMLGFEFARLYPERCAAVIVNGLVVCEPAELADLLRNYNVMPSVTAGRCAPGVDVGQDARPADIFSVVPQGAGCANAFRYAGPGVYQ